MTTFPTAYRPYVPFFPSSFSDLFSVHFNKTKHELNGWQKTAIVVTALAGVLLAGVGVLLGFCLSHYFRDKLADQLMAQPPRAEKTHYFDAEYFDGTNHETIAPVEATKLFYQQKQIGRFCSIHSLCNFAGRNIEGLAPEMIRENNEYVTNLHKHRTDFQEVLEGMKTLGVYIDSLDSIRLKGAGTADVIRYMNNHKDALHLPASCSIQYIQDYIDSQVVKTALQTIQSKADLHRVIVAVSRDGGYSHFSAIRKDAAGQWRVLDSIQSLSTSKTELQPGFPTVEGAVQNFMARHNGNRSFKLIYPSQDTPANALKAWVAPSRI